MSIEDILKNRNTVNLELPTLTLDVNQIPLNSPEKLSEVHQGEYTGLLNFEWNYFKRQSVELCITPQTYSEITQGKPLNDIGAVANQRLIKSSFYKNRPENVRLNLSEPEANNLWLDMRRDLFPNVSDSAINENQKSDVTQIFLHTVASGSTATNAAFITRDKNFLEKYEKFESKYGVQIITANDAWSFYKPKYSLYAPTEDEQRELWGQQKVLIESLEM
mgnify:CR=1 FL=1